MTESSNLVLGLGMLLVANLAVAEFANMSHIVVAQATAPHGFEAGV